MFYMLVAISYNGLKASTIFLQPLHTNLEQTNVQNVETLTSVKFQVLAHQPASPSLGKLVH